jgi:hypothetical protein
MLFSLIVAVVVSENPLPPFDSRVKSLEFTVEGERTFYTPEGAIDPGHRTVPWQGTVRYHHEGGLSLEWRTDELPGGLRKLSLRHGGEAHAIDVLQGKVQQRREIGDLKRVYLNMRLRELPDAWPTLFAPYDPRLANATATSRETTLDGTAYDLVEVSLNGQPFSSYWVRQGASREVAQWEQYDYSQGSKQVVQRCRITLRPATYGGMTILVPSESHRELYKVFNSQTNVSQFYSRPAQVFTTRILPQTVKINTIDDVNSLMFAFDGKTKVIDMTKPQPVPPSIARFQHELKPSDSGDVAKALADRTHSAETRWWLWGLLTAALASGLAIYFRRP